MDAKELLRDKQVALGVELFTEGRDVFYGDKGRELRLKWTTLEALAEDIDFDGLSDESEIFLYEAIKNT